MAIVKAAELEIALYERYKEFVSYGYYVAKRLRTTSRSSP